MKISVIFYVCVFFIVSCSMPKEQKEVKLDLKSKVPLESVESYLQIEDLVRISTNEAFIAKFDKMIPCDDEIYVMDGMQNAIFKIDVRSKSVSKLIDNVGAARNEYLCITDFTIDGERNLLIYDSDSEKINVYDPSGHYVRTMKACCGTSLAISEHGLIGINTGQLEEEQFAVLSQEGDELHNVVYDITYPNFDFGNVRSVAPWEDGFVFTVPFDYHIYEVDGATIAPLAMLNCGEKQCDVEALKKLDIAACRDAIFKMNDKIMYFSNLTVCNNKIFFSTDMNDQILYDYGNDCVMVVSNVESPYNILFSTPLYVNESGQFCNVITNSNIMNAYIPSIEVRGVKSPKLNIRREELSEEDNSFWILRGKVK